MAQNIPSYAQLAEEMLKCQKHEAHLPPLIKVDFCELETEL
jgi:hypothetical protein